MARTTIDYGIDLGTTNSCIAFMADTIPELVPNQATSSLLTPSAIWFDERGRQWVGADAKVHFMDDDENSAVEFKRRMGQDWKRTFKQFGKQMRPEEMSAEVLKSLKADVRTIRGEDIKAAVITVPAAFERTQCDATRRAAELAGLSVSLLLQEPVAAALAYGFQSQSDRVFWLVYDFGGGTFDAAVIQVRDGVIQVVNHAGDNYLGGTNIDWDIVDKVLIPKLRDEYGLTELPSSHDTSDVRWKSVFAKLKGEAEKAKIQVSRTRQPAEFFIDDLRAEHMSKSIDFVYELTPATLEQLLNPWIERSLTLCHKALEEKGLSGTDIEKTILVGGSSLFPWLQDRVAGEFETSVEFSIDPMTVVARGAAVFAASQRLEVPQAPAQDGFYTIQLEYDAVGNEADPTIMGRITPPAGTSVDGLRIEFVEWRSQWRSGTITLRADGTFMTDVHAESGRKCEYEIVLTDSTGTLLACTPDQFTYRMGMVITSSPLTDNVGVAMATNEPTWMFHKGDPLPARKMKIFRNIVALRKDMPYHPRNNVIRIPLIEGNNSGKADRNREVLAMTIMPDDRRVIRDVPVGADIEVTIAIDESGNTTLEAFVPILDGMFTEKFSLLMADRSPEALDRDFNSEMERLQKLKRQASGAGDEHAVTALDRVQHDELLVSVQQQIDAAQVDPDVDRGEADKKLRDLKVALDSVEEAIEWPRLVGEARHQVQAAEDVVGIHGQTAEIEMLRTLVADIEDALKNERRELLRGRLEELRNLGTAVVVRQPEFWIGWFQYVEERKDQMVDQEAITGLFAQGQRAISAEPCDLEALKGAVRQLIDLLPADEREEVEARGGLGGTLVAS